MPGGDGSNSSVCHAHNQSSFAQAAKKDRHRHPEGERMTMAVSGLDAGRTVQVAGPAQIRASIPFKTVDIREGTVEAA